MEVLQDPIPPTKCCSQQHPQQSIHAAAKGLQVTQHEHPGITEMPAQRSLHQKDPFEGTWPYFERLQKDLHIELLDNSSLSHLNYFHFFINQMVKETE